MNPTKLKILNKMETLHQPRAHLLSLSGIWEKHILEHEFFRVVKKELQRCWNYIQNSSMYAVPLYAMAICLGGPLAMFITFAIMTTVVTLIGFILLEGTILSVGALVLAGFLTVAFGCLGTSAIVAALIFMLLKKMHVFE